MRGLPVIFALILATKALECGIHQNKNEPLRGIIVKCMKNQTLDSFLDGTSDESDSSSEELVQNSTRTRRAMSEDQENSTAIPHEITENCVIQCIFDQMEMTDSRGFPDHTKVLDGLLKNTTGREIRDFLQDTTDDCFQDVENENTEDSCEFSSKLLDCMSEKGKLNCADWPVGNLPVN